MIGGFARARIPLGRLAADLAVGHRVDLHLEGLDLFGPHPVAQAERDRERRLRVILGREELEVRALDREGPAGAAEVAELEGPRHLLAKTVASLERGRRPGHPGLGQLRREEPGLRGRRGGAALPHRKLAGPRLTGRHVRGDRDRDRVGHLRHRQAEEKPRAGRRGRRHEHALVPAAITERDVIGQGAEDLVAGDRREQEISSRRSLHLRRGQDGAEHVARMAGAPRDVRVVGVEKPDHDRAGEGRGLRGSRASVTEEPSRRRAARGRRDTPGDDGRLARRAAHGAAERVDHVPLGFLNRARAEILVTERGDVASQRLGRSIHVVLSRLGRRGARPPAARALGVRGAGSACPSIHATRESDGPPPPAPSGTSC